MCSKSEGQDGASKEESFQEDGFCASLPLGKAKHFSKFDIVGDPVIGLNEKLIEIRASYKPYLDDFLARKADRMD